MTLYEKPSFTVPAVEKAPADCKHGWTDDRGKCVFCGEPIPGAVLRVNERREFNDGFRDDPNFPGYQSRDIPNGKILRASWLAKP